MEPERTILQHSLDSMYFTLFHVWIKSPCEKLFFIYREEKDFTFADYRDSRTKQLMKKARKQDNTRVEGRDLLRGYISSLFS